MGEPGPGTQPARELSSSGNRRGLTDARVRPRAGCCGRCDTCLVQLTVLIVDDHEGFRQMARALLEAEGIEVVGEAADGESAITEAERLRPQLVLLDVQLPGIDGFETVWHMTSFQSVGLVTDVEPFFAELLGCLGIARRSSLATYRRRIEPCRAGGVVRK